MDTGPVSSVIQIEQPTLAVVHDGNGTWFSPRDLHVVLLTASELSDLEAGSTSVLMDAFGGATLDGLLPAAVEDPTIDWAWG